MTDDDRQTNLEQAQARAAQSLHVFDEFVVRELDRECWLSIEINGLAVARLVCLDSAMAELAAGWAFMHGFCERPQDLDRVALADARASVMVSGGVDLERMRSALLGETVLRQPVPAPWPRDEVWTVSDDILLDVLREAWDLFRSDRMAEGSIHAALADERSIHVVAFDITAENAVAKVIGWALMEGRLPTYPILILNGAITRAMVDAACRVGILVIATPVVPTADAYRAARLAGISIVGYMRNRVAGLFNDAGLVVSGNPEDDFS